MFRKNSEIYLSHTNSTNLNFRDKLFFKNFIFRLIFIMYTGLKFNAIPNKVKKWKPSPPT